MSNTSITQAELDKIEIRSDEVQEIMSYIPPWIIRWGISVIALCVLSLLFLSWFIRYPEIITARITLSTTPPPIRVRANSSGALAKLFVEENMIVQAGDYLAVLKNAADIDRVLALERQLEDFASLRIKDKHFEALNQLGELQTDYNLWIKRIKEQGFHQQSASFRREKIANLQAQYQELQKVNEGLSDQLKLRERELEIAQNEFEIDQDLYQKETIARVEMEQSEMRYLQQKLSLEQSSNQIHNNQIQLREYSKIINQLKQDTKSTSHSLSLNISDSHQRLLSSLAIWKQRYLMIAPASGKLSFFDVWALHQFVGQGTAVMSIVPNSTSIIGKLALQPTGSGQVKVGQTVNIKLDNYNPQHYGMLQGRIQQIAALPKEDIYVADVALSDGLRTTYGQQLAFKAEMTGTAEIITDNLRLIERVFNQLRLLWDS